MSYNEMTALAAVTARSEEIAKPRHKIVVTSGVTFGLAGATNNLETGPIVGREPAIAFGNTGLVAGRRRSSPNQRD